LCIAQLIKDARFSEPNLLKGVYEELRNAKNIRKIMVNDLKRIKNQMANWLDRYFPEYQRKRSYSHVLSEAKSLSIEKHVLLLLSVGNY